MNASVESLLKAALEHLNAGRLAEAEACYKALSAHVPQHPDVLHGLGLLAHKTGRHFRAAELIQAAINAYFRDGASAHTRAQAHSNLGTVQLALGEVVQAAASFAEAVRLDPRYVLAHYNLGRARSELGDAAGAANSYRRALKLDPRCAEAYYNLAQVCLRLNRLDESMSCLRKVNALWPKFAPAYARLGVVYLKRRELSQAFVQLEHALELDPDLVEALVTIGEAWVHHGSPDRAVHCCKRALSVRPRSIGARLQLGAAYVRQGRAHEAFAICKEAVDLLVKGAGGEEGYYPAHVREDLSFIYSRLAFISNYLSDFTPQDVYAAHRCYGENLEAAVQHHWPHANNRDSERRLKIGYISPDLRLHSVAYFIEPVLAHHNKTRVEVFGYYHFREVDEVTTRLRGYADHWLDCCDYTDDELAQRIRADGIDILVDLAGHTSDNRLAVFARKPAPVQVTYLGYVATTGLKAMDYRLTHADADPPGSEKRDSELLYYLPRSLWCYRPPDDMPAVVAVTPARRNGYVTFGSLNNVAKVSNAAVALWSRVLHAVPGSRLIMAGVPEGKARSHMHARFAAYRIETVRIEFHPWLGLKEFRELHHGIDVMLDPFPHNGNTTTCENLWMGVPVLSLAGDRFVARFGYMLLKCIGLESLAAHDEEEYVSLAVALTCDHDRLDALRAGMRARITTSPLRDEAGFTRDLEAAYRAMWRAWCAQGAQT